MHLALEIMITKTILMILCDSEAHHHIKNKKKLLQAYRGVFSTCGNMFHQDMQEFLPCQTRPVKILS